MQAKQVHFLYAPEHNDVAQGILGDLRSSYIRWQENAPAQLLEELAASESRKDALVLVLVSDNFLKSAECMKRLLAFTQEEYLPMLLPVLVPGRRAAENGGTEEYPTNISTIQDTIFYRDFWYDEWIRLRKQGNLATEDELRDLEARKNFSKKMQPMMNTILRHLNNAIPKSLDELKADNYELLFGKLGLNGLSNEERQMPLSVALGGPEAETTTEEEDVNSEAEEIADAFSIKLPEAEEITVSLPENEEAFALELVEVEETTNSEATETAKSSISAVLDAYREAHEEATTETSQSDLDALLTNNQQENNPQTEQENPVLATTMATVLDNDSSDFQLAAETNIFFDIPVETPVTAVVEAPVYEDFVIGDVDDIDVLFVLADTETEESDYAHAAICFERILALDHDNGRALLGLARLYARYLHRTNDADKTYRKALLCNDENPNLYYEYAMFLQDFVPMQRRRVVELLNDAVELNPFHENAYLALAKQYAANNQPADAKAAYLQACLLNADLRNPGLESQLRIIRHEAPINDPLPSDVVEEVVLQAAAPAEEPNPYADTVVFVSGASSGIGRATAERFIRAGYRVIINARRTERLVEFRNSFDEKQQAQITCLPFDVRNHDEMRAALLSLPEEFKNIDILVNNAGLAKGSSPIHEGRWSDWETMIDTNIKALLALTREVSAQMVANKRGHIINIGSAAAKDAYPNGNVYCATKAAVDMLTRAMRLDLFTHNIRVSAVQPGMVETEFALVRYEDQERATKLYEDIKPLTPEDVADTVFYVATRPEHVNIQDVLMYTRQQAHTTTVDRSGK